MSNKPKNGEGSPRMSTYFKIGAAMFALAFIAFVASLYLGNHIFMFFGGVLLTIGFGIGIVIPVFVKVGTFLGYYSDN